ncbi:hypothetical protein ACOME3_003799 [Neoechinorhynchus agilis]
MPALNRSCLLARTRFLLVSEFTHSDVNFEMSKREKFQSIQEMAGISKQFTGNADKGHADHGSNADNKESFQTLRKDLFLATESLTSAMMSLVRELQYEREERLEWASRNQ